MLFRLDKPLTFFKYFNSNGKINEYVFFYIEYPAKDGLIDEQPNELFDDFIPGLEILLDHDVLVTLHHRVLYLYLEELCYLALCEAEGLVLSEISGNA